MRRFVLILLALLLLCGCEAENYSYRVNMAVDEAVDTALDVELPDSSTNNSTKRFYSYYLPKGVGREEMDDTSNLFTIEGNRAILNLNVASIISRADGSQREIEGEVDQLSHIDYSRTGIFYNNAVEKRSFRLVISEASEEQCYVIIQTEEFTFASVCAPADCAKMVLEMIKILRTCHINENEIISEYSEKSEIGVTRMITLFKEILPESGYISDYVEDWKKDPAFVIIDNTEKNTDNPDASDIEDENDAEEDEEDGQNAQEEAVNE